MKNVADYIEAAMNEQSFKSLRRLATALDIGHSSLVRMRDGDTYPSDETMARLAELARADVYGALCNLNIWRAKSPAVRAYYKDIKRSIRGTAAAGLIGATALTSSGNSDAGTHAMVESLNAQNQFILC